MTPTDQPHLTDGTWQHRLATAHSEAQLLAVARAFLSQLSADERASLPEPCRPPATLRHADDISVYAFELVRRECMQSEFPELGRRLARFFSFASARLAKIERTHAKGAGATRESA
jgi:hypothetical protein